jgi:hypothetical protein
MDFEKKGNQLEQLGVEYKKKVAAQLSDESMSYVNIKCSKCKLRDYCPAFSPNDSGCVMRRDIYERLFAQIEFKTDNPIILNRLRLLARYYTELMLFRGFGLETKAEEIMLLRTTLSEFDKLLIDTKGVLRDSTMKDTLPWEKDPEVVEMKKNLDKAMALEAENEILKAELLKWKRHQAPVKSDSDV